LARPNKALLRYRLAQSLWYSHHSDNNLHNHHNNTCIAIRRGANRSWAVRSLTTSTFFIFNKNQANFKFRILNCHTGVLMEYCPKCCQKLPPDADFCPNCGTKLIKSSNTEKQPSDEIRETLNKMGQEMEKAFNIAVKEMQEAYKTAKSNIQKSVYKEPKKCPKCGAQNQNNAIFCSQCGTKLPENQTEKSESKE